MEKLPLSRLTVKFGKTRDASDPEAAADLTDATDRHVDVQRQSENAKVDDEDVESESEEEIRVVHLRGGGGRSSRYEKKTVTVPARRAHRGSSGSGSYVSYGSGSSYEKKYRKTYSQDPRFRIYCCACM
jgi:hypothetical protein